MIKRGIFLKEKMRHFLIHVVLKYSFITLCGIAGGFLAMQIMRLIKLYYQ